MSAVVILTFLASWNLSLDPTVHLTSPDLFTLPQTLAATMTVLPVLAVFGIARRQFVEGLAHSGLK